MPEDLGNPTRMPQQNDDFATSVTNQILAGFSGLQRELSEMRKLLSQSQKADSKYKFATSDFDDLLSDIRSSSKSSKNTAKDIEGLIKDFKRDVNYAKSSATTKRESLNRQISYSGEYGINKIYSTRVAKSTADIEAKLEKLYEAADNNFSNQLAHLENLEAKKARETEASSKMQRKINELDGKIGLSKDRDEIDALTVLRDQILEAKSKTDSSIESTTAKIESVKKDLEKDLSSRSKEYQTLVRSLRDTEDLIHRELSSVLKAVDDAKSGTDSLKGMSAYLNENVKRPEDVETELDRLARAVEKQKDIIHSAILAIEKKLEDKTLDEQERKNLDYQRQLLVKEYDALNKWTPRQEMFSKAVKTFADAGKSILGAIGNTAIKRIEDYYLNSYKESFNKVYDSIENTRNTVSARLKLDQGGFSDLQADIQNEIEALGIEASVTQSDVNDALVSLQAAGVTDPEMLKSLAIEQAKLIASGSSLNLGNEEMIQNLRQIYQQQLQETGDQQEALNKLSSLIQTAGTAQSAIGASGWDSSLVNGGADRLFNQVANIGITAGKSIEQMSNDLTAAFATSEHMYGIGQDPDAIYSLVNDIINKSVGDYSTLEKILLTSNEISRDALLDSNASLEKNYQDIYSAMKDILQSGTEGDKKYLAEVLSAYGFDMTPEQAVKFMEASDAIRVPTEAEMKQAEAVDKQAREQGTFISETRKHQNKTENSMAEIATEAEKMYKGNDLVNAGFDMVETGLGAIEEVAKNILASMWTNSGTGRAVSSFNLTPEMAKDFALGTKGTTAGAIGKGASVAVGASMMGVSGYNIISSGIESGQPGLDTAYDLFTDTTFQTGLGTTIGGAMGGPVGAAVGGAIFGTFSKLGNWLGSTEKGTELFAQVMGLPSLEDTSQTLAKEMTADANENILAAQKQIEASDEMLAKFEKMTDDQKKLELIRIGALDAQKSATIETQDLNELFNTNLIQEQKNIKEQAEQLLKENALVSENAIQYANIQDTFSETGLGGNKLDAIKKFAGMAGGTGAAADIFNTLSEVNNMSQEEMISYLVGYEEDGKTFDLDTLQNMKSGELLSLAKKKKESSFAEAAGFSGGTLDVLSASYEEWEKRQDRYNEADSKFHNKWEKIYDPNISLDANILAYVDENLKDTASTQEISYFIDAVKESFSSTGEAHLDDKNGYYAEKYVEGHQFATGLTDVPYDNYPAILHKGERILTREEAKAYNEMSSFAVNNLMNNFNSGDTASNVFSTTSYGIDVDKSIGNQTDILSRKLDQVISAINNLSIRIGGVSSQSAAHKNVLRGNSNITQLNTL